jgi:hypothetical protein
LQHDVSRAAFPSYPIKIQTMEELEAEMLAVARVEIPADAVAPPAD